MEELNPVIVMVIQFLIGLVVAVVVVLLGCAFGDIAARNYNVFLCRRIRKYRMKQMKHKDDE